MLIVRTDKTEYGPHETILITLTLQNDTAAATEYNFPSMQRFDVMSKQEGKNVWRWSDDRLFPHVFTKITIQPGDSRVFKVEWNQQDIQGQKVPSGVYTIHGQIVHHAEERGSTVIKLTPYRESYIEWEEGNNVLVIKTDKEKYQSGHPVTIKLMLCNDTATVQEYEFPTSQQYDITIEQGGNTVWTWSEGRFFMQAFTTLTLQPGECRTFTEQWDQVDSTGQQLPEGTYTVRGIIKGTTLEATETIVIK